MKTDPMAMQHSGQRQPGQTPQPQASRWLADLERAWLDTATQPHGGHSGSTNAEIASKPLAPEIAAQAAVQTASSAPAASSSPTLKRSASPVRPQHAEADSQSARQVDVVHPLTPSEAAALPRGAGGLFWSANAQVGTPSVTAGHSAIRPEQSSSVTLQAAAVVDPALTATPSSAALPQRTPASQRLHSHVELAPAVDVAEGQPGAAAPLRYAPHLIQIGGDKQMQANVRDASLQGGQPQAVASALFDQLRQAGVTLRRVYVNGLVFEETPAGASSMLPPEVSVPPNRPTEKE